MARMKKTPKKKDVSNADVLKALLILTDRMATKDDFEYLKHNMVTQKHIEALKGDMESIGQDVDDIKGDTDRINSQMATREDLKMFPTRAEVREIVETAVEDAKEGILAEIRPISRAQDVDSLTIINHERRIVGMERQLAVK